ncbi:PA3496 family putative envelope integrity protein [Spongiibacter sp.]|uniref:PA3496 family putative envelope integrity protein n=1 Tax=Spongiibacter sp. TaxID=2024860 RepID=UPI003562CC34
MAREVAVSDSVDDLEFGFLDDSGAAYDDDISVGGRDNSIRRRIEERLERKRLMEELDMLDDFDL